MRLNGIIFINKKTGISSAGVVREVKRIVKSKVGHGGTLRSNGYRTIADINRGGY